MEINKIEEDKYRVRVDNQTFVMTLDEVMAILSKPIEISSSNKVDLTHLVYKKEDIRSSTK